MKIVTDKNGQVICKAENKSNKKIANLIKKSIWNTDIIKRSNYEYKGLNIDGIGDIDIYNAFSVDVWEDEISIFGDDGIVTLYIIDLNGVKEI